MIEYLAAWVIVGAGGFRYGSFEDRDRAEEYASHIRSARGLACSVVARETLGEKQ
jgi:hypothetical protein